MRLGDSSQPLRRQESRENTQRHRGHRLPQHQPCKGARRRSQCQLHTHFASPRGDDECNGREDPQLRGPRGRARQGTRCPLRSIGSAEMLEDSVRRGWPRDVRRSAAQPRPNASTARSKRSGRTREAKRISAWTDPKRVFEPCVGATSSIVGRTNPYRSERLQSHVHGHDGYGSFTALADAARRACRNRRIDAPIGAVRAQSAPCR